MLRSLRLVLALALGAGCGFEAATGDPMIGVGALELRVWFANQGRGVVRDLPVPITLSAVELDYGAAAGGGADLRCYDAGGTRLPHQLERWEPGGSSVLWVRVPELAAGASDDHIRIVYGDGHATTEDPAALWREYAAVYHLADDLVVATKIADSSPAALHASIVGSLGGDARTTGAIGSAVRFVDQWLQVGNEPQFNVGPGLAHTVEAWFRSPAATRKGFLISNEGACEGWQMSLSAEGFGNGRFAWGGCPAGTAANLTTDPTRLDDDRWHHAALVIDRAAGTGQLYVDGALAATRPVDPDQAVDGMVTRIAAGWDTTASNYAGVLDEVRIARTARDADWIAAAYAAGTGLLVSFESP